MPTLQEFTLTNPNIELHPQETLEVTQCYLDWQTPGLYLTQRIAQNRLVRFVGEKMQTDYSQAIIVIDDHQEELLDKIFSIEQELYAKFRGLRFDVRVRTIPPAENIRAIKSASTITYYDRDQYK